MSVHSLPQSEMIQARVTQRLRYLKRLRYSLSHNRVIGPAQRFREVSPMMFLAQVCPEGPCYWTMVPRGEDKTRSNPIDLRPLPTCRHSLWLSEVQSAVRHRRPQPPLPQRVHRSPRHHGGMSRHISVVSFPFTLLQGILDFSKEFDVSLMDRVVMAFYSGAGQEVRLWSSPRARFGLICDSRGSNNSPSKF